MKTETETPNSDDPLSQGDIIHFPGRDNIPVFGVILNADCDLANSKLDGVISYLPIYTFEEYLKHFWLPNFLREQEQQCIHQILQTLDLNMDQQSFLLDWLNSDDADLVDSMLAHFDVNKKIP